MVVSSVKSTACREVRQRDKWACAAQRVCPASVNEPMPHAELKRNPLKPPNFGVAQ